MTGLKLFDEGIFRIFVKPGEVIEIRGLGFFGNSKAWTGYAKGIVSGYFDDFPAFCEAVKALMTTGQGNLYFTLQVIDPRLIGRSCNRMKAAEQTTADKEVLLYKWLLIDLDPVRPTGISSSDSELQAALDMRNPIIDYCMKIFKFTRKPITAMSGNGIHILFGLPEETKATNEIRDKIKVILENIAEHFNNDVVTVDTSVFNPARICTLYGTTKRKGDPVRAAPGREARPHRSSYIDSLGDYEVGHV